MNITNHAGFVVLVTSNKALLQLRSVNAPIFPNTWGIPGGRIESEKGEKPLEGAIREIEEETGYKCKNPCKITNFPIGRNPSGVVIGHFYYEKYDDKQKVNCYEGKKMEFLSKDKINKLVRMIPHHREIALKAINNEGLSYRG